MRYQGDTSVIKVFALKTQEPSLISRPHDKNTEDGSQLQDPFAITILSYLSQDIDQVGTYIATCVRVLSPAFKMTL